MSAAMDLPEQQPVVWVFDFDGVICDSVGENLKTTWLALRERDGTLPPEPPTGLAARFRRARPVIETGYQNIPLMQMLLEGVTVEEMLADFDSLLSGFMEKHGLTNADTMAAFGAARASWQGADPDGWFESQGFYTPTIAPVNDVARQAVIATTKQTEFARRLVSHAGIRIPLSRVYGMELLGPQKKRSILEAVLERNPGAVVHFFEDRIATLKKLTDLARLKLHLVDWGYNQACEREEAAAHDRMDLLDVAAFTDLLRS